MNYVKKVCVKQNKILRILYCSILLHFPLNYNQFSVLCANTCQFFTFTFIIVKTFRVYKSS
jgi:hypothetical protein